MQQDRQDRDWLTAMRRGFAGRCPCCGEGRLFARWLKVADACDTCGTAFHHHRADDFPAYIVIVIVGHIVIGGMVYTAMETNWPEWLQVVLWPSLALLLSLSLLGPVKGAIVGLQWGLRMHGFGSAIGVDRPLPAERRAP